MTSHQTHRDQQQRSGPALGGIGAGSLEIRSDGIFRNWTIFNNQPLFAAEAPKDREEDRLFFVVRWQQPGDKPRFRLLQIRTDEPSVAGAVLQPYTFRWLRPVETISMSCRWPIAELLFADRDMPFEIALTAWSPFIPGNVKDSSLPGVFFDFEIRPRGQAPVEVLLTANLLHLVGYGCPERCYAGRRAGGEGWSGFEFTADNVPDREATDGSMVLAHLGGGELSHQLGWSHQHVFYEPLIFRSHLPGTDTIDGQNGPRHSDGKRVGLHPCFGSLGCRFELSSEQAQQARFALSWHFPNAYAARTRQQRLRQMPPPSRIEGHAYANHFASATNVMDYLAAESERLETDTRRFTASLFRTHLPEAVLDSVNAQFNTFATSCWLTRAGDFGIQEGLTKHESWGPLATVDVGMYGSIATLILFPELDRSMWECHRRMQKQSGDISHGIGCNFTIDDGAGEAVQSRIDLVPQYVVQVVRHGLYTGDHEMLRSFWPSIERALAYVIDQRDHDHDGIPEMSGANSSYDNFPMFGPATYIASQWIAALDHAIAAADLIGADASRWREVRAQAAATFEEKLWNGSYFSLYNDTDGDSQTRDEGCLTDQLIGQWANDLGGFGTVCAPALRESALDAILARNFLPEEGLFNCRWEGDAWLHPVPENVWYDQANTFWAGVQFAFASFMALEGRTGAATAIVTALDRTQKADGWLWDHIEWGGHYYRSMAAVALPNSYLGLVWHDGIARFLKGPRPDYDGIFLFPGGFGKATRRAESRGEKISLCVEHGRLELNGVGLVGAVSLRAALRLNPIELSPTGTEGGVWNFPNPVTLEQGDTLTLATAH